MSNRFSLATMFGWLVVGVVLMNSNSGQAGQPALEHVFQKQNQPVNVVCFGDSVTGLYYHTGGQRAYTDLVGMGLRRVYPELQIDTLNAGISGNTTVDGLKRIQKDVLDHQPDLVTVMFSLNDMTRVPLKEFDANLRNIVAQCQGVGAAVMLCTPNSVISTPGRSEEKLETYVATIRRLSKELDLPLADCYAMLQEIRSEEQWKWLQVMSDQFHPNFKGHRLIAETIVEAATGKKVSLADVAPLQPAIPFTLARLKNKQPVKIVAMPPYDRLIETVIKQQYPEAQLEIVPWEVKGMNLQQIEASAGKIRGIKPNLVIIAVPWESSVRKTPEDLYSFTWVMNKSLAFGRLEWDCFVVSPNLLRPAQTKEEQELQQLVQECVRNQDLNLVERGESQEEAVDVLGEWWKGQLLK